MENLFYSPSEKILFYVAGYTDNYTNVKEIISMYKNNYDFFYKVSGIKEINTYLVEKSSKYKGMRVFYCKTDNPPADAFNLEMDEETRNRLLKSGYTEDQIEWTMMKWLTN